MRFEGMENCEVTIRSDPSCQKQKKTMNKYILGAIGGILFAVLANFTAPITIINFITMLFMGVFKLFCTLIGCFLAYIVFMILGRCIPIITSKMWEQICWTWEQIKDYEENNVEI